MKGRVEFGLLGFSLAKEKVFRVDAGLWLEGKVAVKTRSQTRCKVA